MRYLSIDDILEIHQTMISLFGGESGLLSEGALENCVAVPMIAVFGIEPNPTLWDKAASLMHCIVTRHPFVDGNKRTAWASMKVFLLLNDYRLATETEESESVILNVIGGVIDIDALSKWIEAHSTQCEK